MAYELHKHLSKRAKVELVKWGGSSRSLPVVFFIFFFKSIWLLLTRKIDVIYLGDGVMAPLGFLFNLLGKRVAITIHALDIVYPNRMYQWIIPRCVARLDRIICISDYTKDECVKRGIDRNKIIVIPNGVADELYLKDKNVLEIKEKLEKSMNISFGNKKVIISVGRLVKRKGFHWFVESVIPELLKKRRDFIYILAGEGVLKEKIIEIAQEKSVSEYICVLGKVDDETLKLLYNAGDIFVMPNVPVEGDTEGFGIVALEACTCCLPVVASDIEGIKDALKGCKNAFLLQPMDEMAYVETINSLLNRDGKSDDCAEDARKFIIEKYNWRAVSDEYLRELELIAKK